MTSTGSSSSAATPDLAPLGAGLVVGMPAYDSGERAEAAAAACRLALERLPAGGPACFVLADAGSTDDTHERVRRALGGDIRLIVSAYPLHAADLLHAAHGVPARTRASVRILEEAQQLGAQACVVLDPATAPADPGAVEALARPVLGGTADFVSTYQVRQPYAGAIVKGVLAPLFRALYGVRLRNPMADTFACSASLIQHYVEEAQGLPDALSSPIDLQLTATAVCDGFTVAETALGRRPEEAREGVELSEALAQAVGALFGEIGRRPDAWQKVRRSAPAHALGGAPPDPAGPPDVPINLERLVESFRLGYRELRTVWAAVLPPRLILELKKLADLPADRFAFEDELWAQMLYDFAVGHQLRLISRDHLLRSLAPLYLGWFASFVRQVQGATPAEVDERLDRLGAAFEQQKPYLLSRWRWPERGKAVS